MKALFLCILFSLCSVEAEAQWQDSLSFEVRYQSLFDTTQTREDFLENINGFIQAIEYKRLDSTVHWHRGQTDYEIKYFEDSLHTVNSTTYFNNSMLTTLYVDQLLYNGKVIRRESSGGLMVETYEQSALLPSYSFQITDSVFNPDAPKKEQVSVPVKTVRECTEAYLNHELGIKVVFRARYAYFDLLTSQRQLLGGPMDFRRRFEEILSISFQPLTEEDSPYIFIENN